MTVRWTVRAAEDRARSSRENQIPSSWFFCSNSNSTDFRRGLGIRAKQKYFMPWDIIRFPLLKCAFLLYYS